MRFFRSGIRCARPPVYRMSLLDLRTPAFHHRPMLTFRSPVASRIGAALLTMAMIAGCSRCSSPPEKKLEPTAVPTIPPTQVIAATATVEPTLAPTVNAEPAASAGETPPATGVAAPEGPKNVELCKQAIKTLAKGDVSALKKLPVDKQADLEKSGLAMHALNCIAIADNTEAYCNSLSSPRKDECLAQVRLILGVKQLKKGEWPLPLVVPEYYKNCLTQFPKQDCEKFREAWMTGKAGGCKGLAKNLSALCSAVLSGNAAQCPPTEADCAKLIVDLSRLQQGGIEALDDPMTQAATKGKAACAPYLEAAERFCIE